MLALLLTEMVGQDLKEPEVWVKQQLKSPRELWRQPFRRLSAAAQCLMYCVALSPDVICVSDLKRVFYALYRKINGHIPLSDVLDAALLEVEPNFVVTESRCGHIWVGFANGGVEDLVIGLIEENPMLVESLIDVIDHFELGLTLFSFNASDKRPIALDRALQLRLIKHLVGILEKNKQQLVRRQTNVANLDDAWEIKTSSFGMNVAGLWLAGRSSLVRNELVTILEPILASLDWTGLSKQAQTVALLDMLLHFPSYQIVGWAAIKESMLDSADAAAIAAMCQYSEQAAAVFLEDAPTLFRNMEDVCCREIERASDEYHIGAVMEDMESIEALLGFSCKRAWLLGNHKLEQIFSGDADDGSEVNYYQGTQADDFREWMQLTQPEDERFVESLFSEFAEIDASD